MVGMVGGGTSFGFGVMALTVLVLVVGLWVLIEGDFLTMGHLARFLFRLPHCRRPVIGSRGMADDGGLRFFFLFG